MNAGRTRPPDALLKVERPTTTLKELALEKLRGAILGFHFQPGERLVERRLTGMLGVSRTVVREVLRHLEAEGLVETLPYHGPVVARLDLATVDQIYELRAAIEVLATRACAEHIDARDLERLEKAMKAIEKAFKNGDMARILEQTTRFYEIVFISAGKTVAWNVFSNLNARINQLRAMTLSSEGRSRTGPAELRRILDAIRNHDPDAAERACREHVQRAHEIARLQLQCKDEAPP
jgi:DNA-binding GntR family transcriptional regulator